VRIKNERKLVTKNIFREVIAQEVVILNHFM